MTSAGEWLVIGCGNTLRRDDGVGPRVVAALAPLNLSGLRAMACHQLTPELAEPISQASGVIFVDADLTVKDEVRLRQIEPGEQGHLLAHTVDPAGLLGLARALFGAAPSAWLLSIPVHDLGFGEDLSPLAEAGVQAAIKQICDLHAAWRGASQAKEPIRQTRL